MEEKIMVSINNEPHEILKNSSLEAMITKQKISFHSVSTAVNNTFVPKTERAHYILKDGDSVIFFSAITGG